MTERRTCQQVRSKRRTYDSLAWALWRRLSQALRTTGARAPKGARAVAQPPQKDLGRGRCGRWRSARTAEEGPSTAGARCPLEGVQQAGQLKATGSPHRDIRDCSQTRPGPSGVCSSSLSDRLHSAIVNNRRNRSEYLRTVQVANNQSSLDAWHDPRQSGPRCVPRNGNARR